MGSETGRLCESDRRCKRFDDCYGVSEKGKKESSRKPTNAAGSNAVKQERPERRFIKGQGRQPETEDIIASAPKRQVSDGFKALLQKIQERNQQSTFNKGILEGRDTS